MKRWIAAVLLPLLVLTACACGGVGNKETEYYEVGEIVEYAPFGEKAAVFVQSGQENAVMIAHGEALIVGEGEFVLASVSDGQTESRTFTAGAAKSQLAAADVVFYVGEKIIPKAVVLPDGEPAPCEVTVPRGECAVSDGESLYAVKTGSGQLLLREKNGNRGVFVGVTVLKHTPEMKISVSALETGESAAIVPEFSDGKERTVVFEVESGEDVVTINDNVITATGKGEAIIRAEAEGEIYRFTVVAGQKAPATATLKVDDISLFVGQRREIIVYGENLPENAETTFEIITGGDIVEIDGKTVKALKSGTASVRCREEISGAETVFSVTVTEGGYKLTVDDGAVAAGDSFLPEPVLLPERAGTRYRYEITRGEQYLAVAGKVLRGIKPGSADVRCYADEIGVYADFSVTVTYSGTTPPEGYVKLSDYLYVTVPAGRYSSAQKLDFFTTVAGAEIYYNTTCEKIDGSLTGAEKWTAPAYLTERAGQLSEYSLIRQIDAALTWAGGSKDYSGGYVSRVQNGKQYTLINRAYVFNVAVVFDGEIIDRCVSSYIIWDNPAADDVPIISLSAPEEVWFDGVPDGKGKSVYNNVYVLGTNTASEIAVRANLEFFDADGTGFSVNTQVKVGGGWSRGRPQRTLHLNFNKDENGDKQTPVKHKIFGDRQKRGAEEPLDEFTRFRLWNGGSTYETFMRFNDAFLQLTARDLEVSTTAVRPALVYINGEFWGMYYLREHYSDFYFHYNYNVERDNVQYFDYVGGVYNVSDGNEQEAKAFIDEMNAYLNNPANNFADDAVYDAFFDEYVDEKSFIDYFIVQSWCGNWDCVGNNNNHRVWRVSVFEEGNPYTDGKLRFALHDLDMGMQNDASLNGQYINLMDPSAPYSFAGYNMIRKALENRGFRQRFYERAVQLAETVLSYEETSRVLTELADSVRGLIDYNVRLWSQDRNVAQWESELSYGHSWLQRRNSYYLPALKQSLGV